MLRRAWVYLLAGAAVVGAAALADGCGGDDTNVQGGDGGGTDGTGAGGGGGTNAGGGGGVAGGGGNAGGGGINNDAGVCKVQGAACTANGQCCSATCDSNGQCSGSVGQCLGAGVTCQYGPQCCSQTCTGGTCAGGSCTADNAACTTGSQCCSGTCGTGGDGGAGQTCTPLNTTCKTSGNPCAQNSDCCSKFCTGGLCENPSFCIQTGDVCASSTECCSGVCNITSGTLGTCGTFSGSSNCNGGVDGIVCGACTDCCSDLCAPYLNTGINICQPAEGCHITGDLCGNNLDCCGGDPNSGLPGAGNVQCCALGTQGASCPQPSDGGLGYCSNGQSCTPEGDVCHFKNYVCGNSTSSASCCGGLGAQSGVCQLDALGVPRCLAVGGDAGGTCVQAGNACAFNGDCCNGVPCVAGPDGGLVCSTSSCSPSTGPCTTTSDCCDGLSCYVPPGSTSGTCGPPPGQPDGGSAGGGGGGTAGGGGGGTAGGGGSGTCDFFGQACTQTTDCCDTDAGIQCISNICAYPIH